MHGALLDSGEIEQTGKEKAATEQELASCGLPEEYQPMPRSRPPLPAGLLVVAVMMLKEHPPDYHRELVENGVRRGVFSAEDGEKILALAAATE